MTPSQKLQAKAEALFAEACRLRGCEVEPLPRGCAKTPDFRVRLGQADLIAEVKSQGLDPQIDQHMKYSSRTLVLKPGKRVRSLIGHAEGQLAACVSDAPKILVICDLRHLLPDYPMYPLFGFNDSDMAAGMFGEMIFRCRFHNGRLVHNGPEFGPNRTLRRDHYTHVSAVALLLVGQDFELGPIRVYHNPFATRPLPLQWFQFAGDRQFWPGTEDGQIVFRWEEQ